MLLVEELLVLGRTFQCAGGRIALDGGGHGVEVTGAHYTLVLDGGEALLGSGELGLLQFDKGAEDRLFKRPFSFPMAPRNTTEHDTWRA